MQALIQETRTSKSGKTLSVKVDGKWYTAALNTGLGSHVGEMITFDPKPQTLPDGGTITWIDQFTLSGKPPEASPNAPGGVNGGGAGRYQPLVSNLAAHLIAAGKAPSDLYSWYTACKAILEPADQP